ncbi:MAG TPA: PBP1A family penicillin-binding protein [Bacteroidales bacterium]|nr:PBP1A family penicillin-binding protein [Bacteroidales bacterium]HRZ47953.1 PBP1A family penicillin-binding protein [Bacteroidales bacterium]
MSDRNGQLGKIIRRMWRLYLGAVGFIILMLVLAGIGAFGYMPDLRELENPKSQLASEIFAADGALLGTYYRENRTNTRYEEISPNLINALVATEDVRFVKHSGVDMRSMGRMVFGVLTLSPKGGASTITQQLAKNLFPRERLSKPGLVLMKFKEWVLASKLERRFTKKEILMLYFNTVSFGNNSYGVKIAAKTYFGKEPANLNIEESAMLVALLKGPSYYNPKKHPERALTRRNFVLRQMGKAGYLTLEEYKELENKPVDLSNYRLLDHITGPAPYLREHLRKIVSEWAKNFKKPDGTSYDIYKDGLKIYTTIDSRMQKYAEEAMTEHLKGYLQPEFYKHWSGRKNAPFNNMNDDETEKLLRQAMRRSDRYIEMKAEGYSQAEIEKSFHTPADMTVFSWNGDVDTVMTPWDSIRYYKFFLRSGMVSIDPVTGHVKAYVGGINFKHFKYDQVVDGKRQVGSTFKPFVYTMAIQEGESPCAQYPNTPITIQLESGQTWSPRNSGDHKDGQMVNLKEALAHSINRISARLIDRYTPAGVVQLVKNLGITSDIPAVPSICLGSADLSVMEMTAAYAAYANRGVYTRPMLITRIEDRHGTLLQAFSAETRDAMSEKTAYLMVELMKGVVQYGTGTRLRSRYGLSYPIAGKTGTTDNNSDGWFIGLTPSLVTGVWVGCEDRSAHFRSTALGQGASMALPVWALYMQRIYKDPKLDVSKGDFPKPEIPINETFNCEEYQLEEYRPAPPGGRL